jgi:MFS transporter, OFA family, oxalate/formate antiporter
MKTMKKSALLVLAAAVSSQLCVGILYMWGVFQPYVSAYHGWKASGTAMTSAFMIVAFVAGTIASGAVQERVAPRIVAMAGSVLFCSGMFLTSLLPSDPLWLIYITYSGLSGIGTGLVFSTSLAVVQKWYAARMGMATGLCVGAFGLSIVIFTPVAEKLLSSGGVPFTFRTLSIIFLVITMTAGAFFKNPDKAYYYAELSKVVPPENIRQFKPGQMLRSMSYYYILTSMFTLSAAYLIIVPFIRTIAEARGMSTFIALTAIMLSGVANASGRMLMPAVSDRIGRTRSIILCAVISAFACTLMIFAQGIWYIAAVFLIAFAYGGSSGVNPVITTELFGARYSGANYGLVLIGIAASSIVFSRLSMKISAEGIVTGDFTSSLILSALLCAIPILMMILLRKRVKRLGKII